MIIYLTGQHTSRIVRIVMKHIALKDMGTTGLISFVVNGSNRMRGARLGKALRIVNARYKSWDAHVAFTKAVSAAVHRKLSA